MIIAKKLPEPVMGDNRKTIPEFNIVIKYVEKDKWVFNITHPRSALKPRSKT